MGYYYPMRYSLGFDWTFLLIIAALVFSLIVQAKMRSTFSKYSSVRSSFNLTGAQVAKMILESEGMYNVSVGRISGSLTDHYDPKNKRVSLSDSIYGSTSIAAIGVAAHECGHAMQDASGYTPLYVRGKLVPAANIGARLSWPLFIFGLLLSVRPLLWIGILLFCFALAFQLVTLPVELNASRRAMQKLKMAGVMGREETRDTSRVLRAAAMTYVAAVIASILQLLRLLALSGRRRN